MPDKGGIPGAPISDGEFALIRGLVHERFGINLTGDKKALVVGRLRKALESKGGISFGEYHDRVLRDPTGAELSELIDRISTNHTFFNREKEHFDFFRRSVLPEAAERARRRGSRDVRIWCAASSTGEEPYMLAMLMREHFGAGSGGWDLGLLATDISEKALAKARAGVYSREQAEGLPADLLRKYFRARPDGAVEASPALKADVTYRRFNLVNAEYPFRRPFDAIFCRNVMIYFDNPTKEGVVRNMARFLVPGGYFFLGHSETLGRSTPDFDYVQPAVYRRKP